jgi:hypothetical protein
VAADPILPRAQAAIAGNLPPAPVWYDFLRQLLVLAQETGGLPADLTELAARVTELEESALGDFSIQGLVTVRVFGTPQNGVVQISLDNDDSNPGNTYYYGTGPTGTKGWFAVADALAVDDGVTSFGLEAVADSGAGSLLAVTRDGFGRVTGTKAATITAGSGVTVTNGDAVAGLPTVAHADTSSVANVTSDNSNGVVLQDVSFTFDAFGHVTGATAGTVDLDLRYDSLGSAAAALAAANTYTDDEIAALQVSSGTWTPTLTNTTNVASSTSNPGGWTIIGDVVQFSVRLAATATAGTSGAPVSTILEMSLPVAVDLIAVAQAAGCATIGESPYVAGQVSANTANNTLNVAWFATSTSNRAITITGSYRMTP